MLASKFRLKGSEVFKKVQKKGEVFQSESFGVAFIKERDFNYPRFGHVISTKISKLSTQRNKIRRAINEVLRTNIIYANGGYNVVFLIKPQALRTSTDLLMKEVKKALFDIGIFK